MQVPVRSSSIRRPRPQIPPKLSERPGLGQARLLRDPGRPARRRRRRAEEGLSRGRDARPPGPQPGRCRRPRSASRRPRRPTPCSPTRRSAAPTTASATPASAPGRRAAASRTSATSGGFTDLFDDLFGDLFGGGRARRAPPPRSRPARRRPPLQPGDRALRRARGHGEQGQDPEDAAVQRLRGVGRARRARAPSAAARCRGSGQVVLQQGFFRVSRPCDDCAGTGEIAREHCSECRGQGRVEGQQTINVRIPSGVEDGTRLRLAGEGEAGIAGGPPGDLYVVISIKPHELFERDGPDLHCEVPVTMVQAALGAEIDVPTLEGKVKLKIPEGTQSGKVMRLRGKGLPTLRSSARGDQLVRIFVETPTQAHQAAARAARAVRGGVRHEGLAGPQGLPRQAARAVRLMRSRRLLALAPLALVLACAGLPAAAPPPSQVEQAAFDAADRQAGSPGGARRAPGLPGTLPRRGARARGALCGSATSPASSGDEDGALRAWREVLSESPRATSADAARVRIAKLEHQRGNDAAARSAAGEAALLPPVAPRIDAPAYRVAGGAGARIRWRGCAASRCCCARPTTRPSARWSTRTSTRR